MKFSALSLTLAASMIALTGCCKKQCIANDTPEFNADGRRIVRASYTTEDLSNDPTFKSSAWKKAPTYQLTRPNQWQGYYESLEADELAKYGETVLEDCTMKILYDDNNLYLGFQVTDKDIKATGTADQQAHFVTGDVIEIFVKPADETYYWEMYSTPQEFRTCYEFESYFKGVEGNDKLQLDFTVNNNIDGTLNDSSDIDTGWSTVVTIPFISLAKHGKDFTGNEDWTLLIGRYNYLDENFAKEELTCFPEISKVSFHVLDEYAAIKFNPKKGNCK